MQDNLVHAGFSLKRGKVAPRRAIEHAKMDGAQVLISSCMHTSCSNGSRVHLALLGSAEVCTTSTQPQVAVAVQTTSSVLV